MKKITKVLCAILVISIIFTGCAEQATQENTGAEVQATDNKQAEPVVWKIESAYGPGDQCWDVHLPIIADTIEEVSGGLISVETYAPGSICEAPQIPASVANGVLEGALSANGDTCQMVEAAYAESGIPFYWETPEQTYDCLYNGGLLDYLRREYEEVGIRYGMYLSSGKYSLMTSFKVEEASDIKGRKVRATGGYGEWIKELGGSPVVMPGGDVYMAIKLDTIEGTLFGLSDIEGMGFKEVVDYVVEQPISAAAPTNIIFNKKAWDALPSDVQTNIDAALQELFLELCGESTKLEEDAIAKAKEYGVEFVKVSDEEVKKFAEAGSRMADVLGNRYPVAQEGFQIIKDWKASTN